VPSRLRSNPGELTVCGGHGRRAPGISRSTREIYPARFRSEAQDTR
jgi:hypothetical protein